MRKSSAFVASVLGLVAMGGNASVSANLDEVSFNLNTHEASLLVSPEVATTALGGPQILTFEPYMTVGQWVAADSFKRIFGSGCSIVELDEASAPRQTVKANMFIFDALSRQDIAISCPSRSHSIKLNPVVDFRNEMPSEYFDQVAKFLDERRAKVDKAMEEGRLADLPEYPLDLIDLSHITTKAVAAWATTWTASHFGPLHQFQNYGPNNTITYGTDANMYEGVPEDTPFIVGMYEMSQGLPINPKQSRELSKSGKNSKATITLTADWASGTYEAQLVSELMVKEYAADYTINIGDIYYMGTPNETRSNCLGERPANAQRGVTWHQGSKGSFAFEGNHEMYSRGFGYFDVYLPTLGTKYTKSEGKTGNRGQRSSYAVLENEQWRVIGLDTGFNSYGILGDNDNNGQPASVISWLKNVVKINDPADKRGLVLLTHHQHMSAFAKEYTATYDQISELLGDRTVLWLWGHEHKLAFYKAGSRNGKPLKTHGRCVGVGGFPTDPIAIPEKARDAGLFVFDDRKYEILEGDLGTSPAGFNGYAALLFDGDQLTIEYRTLQLKNGAKNDALKIGKAAERGVREDKSRQLNRDASNLVVREVFSNKMGNVELVKTDVLDKGMTILTHDDSIAPSGLRADDLAAMGLDMTTIVDAVKKQGSPMRSGLLRHAVTNNKQLLTPDMAQEYVDKLMIASLK